MRIAKMKIIIKKTKRINEINIIITKKMIIKMMIIKKTKLKKKKKK